MTFTDWLLKQDYRDDCIGDLARDAHLDSTKPKNGIRMWNQHLTSMRASPLAFDALKKAWIEYRVSSIINLLCK